MTTAAIHSVAPASAATAAPALNVRTHLPALDGIRGMAILLVMVHHFFSAVSFEWRPAERLAQPLRSGWIGVDLFFVLSGFLITGILLDARGKPHYFRNFYARRSLRIFPLYFAVLGIVLLLAPWTMPASDPGNALLRENFSSLFTYLTNFTLNSTQDFHSFEGTRINFVHFWSLAVEEHFYLVWPFVVAFLSRRTLAWATGGMIALSIGSKVLFAVADPGNIIATYTLTPCRMDSLLIGAAVAILARSPAGVAAVAREAKLIVSLGFPVLLGVVVLQGEISRNPTPLNALIYPVLAILFAGLLCHILATGGILRSLFESGTLRFFGVYSYGLYIFHGCLESAFHQIGHSSSWQNLPLNASLKSAALVLAWFTASLACALASRFLLEAPILKLKRYF